MEINKRTIVVYRGKDVAFKLAVVSDGNNTHYSMLRGGSCNWASLSADRFGYLLDRANKLGYNINEETN